MTADRENHRIWEAKGDALRERIAALRAEAEASRFDNDDSRRDAPDEAIREIEAQLAIIERLLAESGSGPADR